MKRGETGMGAGFGVVADYVAARGAYEAAQAKADEAFARYFERRASGERTNGAAWQRAENTANYLSARLASAENACWKVDPDFDPDKVWAEAQVSA